ncbi:Inactive hydroxysteroid dehydrogenase-like protein 1 [Seminavis robusta]|uniref:Inactive hydroxysteroid dehydrogenase-like protein 1 n=1 Tax=Seminavis robusta TaxID=568900 RepID=A0A9N8H6K7_9STRA|nr:Inactive hydroxysteroid dehydrogenase-like protein 1 [Seminavis robusta]|eukprot:Sro102_g052250.1 Inactive hydroxysteroid dehydrogenase-like protein 1 (307) ;mRNA; r:112517-113437
MNVLVALLVVLLAVCWISFRKQPVRFTSQDTKFRDRYGEWAIVAGASGEGLGAAWADALCELHVNVLLIARREPQLMELKKTLENKYSGCKVDTLVQDLSAADLVDVFADLLLGADNRQYGFLVHNAAYSHMGPFLDAPLEKHSLTVDIDVRSVMTMTHQFGNYLKSNGRTGGIIIMSSMAGEIGSAFVSNYAATKGFDTAFTQAVSYELKPLGIDLLACVAGCTVTPNYIKVAAAGTRNPIIEQTPEQVVEECIQGIGVKASIRTGFINKLIRFFMVRVLPLEFAIQMFGSETEKLLEGTVQVDD